MAGIEVVAIGTGQFRVEVSDDAGSSGHTVTVPDGYAAELGVEDRPLRALVRESFRFLLEREPKEAILEEFDLPTIARYFPEYPDVIAERVRSAEPEEPPTYP